MPVSRCDDVRAIMPTMHIRELLARARSLHPTRVAIVDATDPVPYAVFADRVARVAGTLAELGVRAGDRVAVLATNRPAYLELYFACAHLDAILVALNTRLAPPELAAILRDAEAGVLGADAMLAPVVATAVGGTDVRAVLWLDAAQDLSLALEQRSWTDARRAAPAPPGSGRGGDQVAHLYYTSGTTGRPKGVMLTHRNVCSHALMAVAELSLRETDVWGHIAPMFHLADAWACFAITQVGGAHAFVPRFDPGVALAALVEQRVTCTNLVPTMVNLMVKDATAGAQGYPHLRCILSGGAPIASQVVEQVVAVFGCEYVQTYGMTETSPFLTMSLLTAAMRTWPVAAQMRVRSKTGRPVLGVALRVVRDDGDEVARDEREVGEIQVCGETVTPGYWRQPDATAAAFTADGYLRTGDLAVVDAEGYVTIVDRKKDVILTGGEKVYSTEVEHALYAHPAVLEAAAYGVADPVWGESVAAAVVLRAGAAATADELAAFCRARLGGFKVPRTFRFLETLPRTGSGKIAKRFLRDGMWAMGETAEGAC